MVNQEIDMPDAVHDAARIAFQQLDASRQLAEVVLTAVERVDNLLHAAIRRTLDEQWEIGRAVASANGPQALMALQAEVVKNGPGGLAGYQWELLKILSETGQEVGQCLTESWQKMAQGQAGNGGARGQGAGPATADAMQQATQMADMGRAAYENFLSAWSGALQQMNAWNRDLVALGQGAEAQGAPASSAAAAAAPAASRPRARTGGGKPARSRAKR